MKKMCQSITVILFLASTLTSCLNSRMVDRHLAKEYGSVPKVSLKKGSETVKISSPLLNDNDTISKTIHKFHNVIPLIVYWHSNNDNYTTLNAKIPLSRFTSTVQTTQNIKKLNEKIGGKKLDLYIDSIPQEFSINYYENIIFLILFQIKWSETSIKGKETNLVVRYKLSDNAQEIKQGTIVIPYPKDKMVLGMFKSWKKATSEFLEKYHENIDSMTKQCIDKLVQEIQ